MKAKYINPLIGSSKTVLENWINNKDILIGKPKLKKSPQKFNDILVNIGITGDIKGQVIFGFKYSTFFNIAGKMMMSNIKEVNEMSKSAVGELVNMIMGHTSTSFSNNNVITDITTPVIYEGKIDMTSSLQFLCIPFEIEDSLLEIFLTLEES